MLRSAAVICLGSAAAAVGPSQVPLVVGGSLAELYRQFPGQAPTETDLIVGGHNVTLSLGQDVDQVRFRKDILSVFDDLVDHLVVPTEEAEGLHGRLRRVLRRDGVSVSDDGLTLTLRFSADPDFNIGAAERIWFQIHSSALDCDCPYSVPSWTPIVVYPMSLPPPVITVPELVCADTLDVRSGFGDCSAPVPTAVRVTWAAVVGDKQAVVLRHARSTTIRLPPVAGQLRIAVSYHLRDTVRSTSVSVRRLLPPRSSVPAELHVSGPSVRLAAEPTPSDADTDVHEWRLVRTAHDGATPTLTVNDSGRAALLEGVGRETVVAHVVTSRHPICGKSESRITVKREDARFAVAPPREVCGGEVSLEAVPPQLTGIKQRWESPTGAVFATGARGSAVTAKGLSPGENRLRYVLEGDGGSASAAEVVVHVQAPPAATILWDGPREAYINRVRKVVRAVVPVDGGSGRWSLNSTCDPPLGLLYESGAHQVVDGLAALADPCEATLRWTVSRPPCGDASDTVAFSVAAEPPSDPSVDSTVVLCGGGTAELRASAPTVGVARWSVLGGSAAHVHTPGGARTMLSGVPPGETVVRRSVTSVYAVKSADVKVVRYPQPDAVVLEPEGGVKRVCGDEAQLRASTSLLTLESAFGEWVVPGSVRVSTAIHRQGDSGVADLSGLPPGRTLVRWETNTQLAEPHCPDGNVAEVVVDSVQLPDPGQLPLLYTVNPHCDLNLSRILDMAIDGMPAGRQAEFRSAAGHLAEKPGQWSTDAEEVTLVQPSSQRALVTHLQKGTTVVAWSTRECGQAMRLPVGIVYRDKLSCSLSVRGLRTERGWQTVGSEADVTATVSEAATGEWFSRTEGLLFTAADGGTSVRVSGIPASGAEIRYRVSRLDSVFDGECVATLLPPLRATVPSTSVRVCDDWLTLSAIPPAHVPGLDARWRVVSGGGFLSDPLNSTTTVTGLSRGLNELQWTLRLEGGVDAAAVAVQRDVVPLPFGAGSLTATRWVFNSSTAVLPWAARPEWPAGVGAISAPDYLGIGLSPGNGTFVVSGLVPVPVDISFLIVPATPSCPPARFSLRLNPATVFVTARHPADECELLRGAVLTIEAATDVPSVWGPPERLGAGTTAGADLRAALGSTLGPALLGVKVRGSAMELHFSPIQLRANGTGEALSVSLDALSIPTSVWHPAVIAPGPVPCYFHTDAGLRPGFSVHPIVPSVKVGSSSIVSEVGVNQGAGDLRVRLMGADVGRVAERLRNGTGEMRRFVSGISALTQGNPGDVGWNARVSHIVTDASMRVDGSDLVFPMAADDHYAISASERVRLAATVADVCGLPPAASAVLTSNSVLVEDSVCVLKPQGRLSECGFDEGATVEVVAEGCSFANGADLTPMHFTSDRQGLPKGWNAVRRRLSSVSTSQGPKRRSLRLLPDVGSYHVPDNRPELLTIELPRSMLVAAPLPTPAGVWSLPDQTPSNRLMIEATHLESIGAEVCMDALRTAGHTVTLRLHGDSWTPSAAHWADSIFGGLAASGGTNSSWRAAIASLISSGSSLVTYVNESDLTISIPPLPDYKECLHESIAVELPAKATRCRKCLRSDRAMHILSHRALLPKVDVIRRPANRTVHLLPVCGRSSFSTWFEELRSAPECRGCKRVTLRKEDAGLVGDDSAVDALSAVTIDEDGVQLRFSWEWRWSGPAEVVRAFKGPLRVFKQAVPFEMVSAVTLQPWNTTNMWHHPSATAVLWLVVNGPVVRMLFSSTWLHFGGLGTYLTGFLMYLVLACPFDSPLPELVAFDAFGVIGGIVGAYHQYVFAIQVVRGPGALFARIAALEIATCWVGLNLMLFLMVSRERQQLGLTSWLFDA